MGLLHRFGGADQGRKIDVFTVVFGDFGSPQLLHHVYIFPGLLPPVREVYPQNLGLSSEPARAHAK